MKDPDFFKGTLRDFGGILWFQFLCLSLKGILPQLLSILTQNDIDRRDLIVQ